jgi:hypothetical protein
MLQSNCGAPLRGTLETAGGFRVSHDLFADFHNGREYERFAGRAITVPRALTDQPDPELLDWHAMEVFRG